jgi:hypothetical protein
MHGNLGVIRGMRPGGLHFVPLRTAGREVRRS